jgi:hypothetical protein
LTSGLCLRAMDGEHFLHFVHRWASKSVWSFLPRVGRSRLAWAKPTVHPVKQLTDLSVRSTPPSPTRLKCGVHPALSAAPAGSLVPDNKGWCCILPAQNHSIVRHIAPHRRTKKKNIFWILGSKPDPRDLRLMLPMGWISLRRAPLTEDENSRGERMKPLGILSQGIIFPVTPF